MHVNQLNDHSKKKLIEYYNFMNIESLNSKSAYKFLKFQPTFKLSKLCVNL